MRILVTGSCGFIGFHLCHDLLSKTNYQVIGIDNLNSYYDVKLKKSRLNILKTNKNYIFFKIDICNQKKLENLFNKFRFCTFSS